MHSAPSVSYPVGRSRFSAALAAMLWLLAAAVMALWLLQASAWGLRQGGAALMLAVSGLYSLKVWREAAAGQLRWDTRAWHWSGVPFAGAPDVVLDFQHCMLVRWRMSGGRRSLWLWIERSGQPQRWGELRRAVYSRASTADTPPHDSRAANP